MKPNRVYHGALLALLSSSLLLFPQEPRTESKRVENFRRSSTAPVPEFAPQRVILGWIGDPSRSQAVTWRTEKAAGTPQVQFARGSPDPAFAAEAKNVAAQTSILDIGNGKSVATYR